MNRSPDAEQHAAIRPPDPEPLAHRQRFPADALADAFDQCALAHELHDDARDDHNEGRNDDGCDQDAPRAARAPGSAASAATTAAAAQPHDKSE